MRKYVGNIYFAVTEEAAPGVYVSTLKKKKIKGEEFYNRVTRSEEGTINAETGGTIRLEIYADKYTIDNHLSIKKASYHGYLWSVTSVELRRPRVVLTLGDIDQNGGLDE